MYDALFGGLGLGTKAVGLLLFVGEFWGDFQ